MEADLILIHPPSLYDFRVKRVYYGPISDVVPSTPIFELYPAGFLSILTYLGKRGFKVRILNLATRMLMDSKFDPEREIKRIRAKLIGVDFHWMVHVQGALKVAELVKKFHPETPVVFGGLSSTFFWKELIKRGIIDFIVLGDTVEDPLRRLLEYVVDRKGSLQDIPNLAWKNGQKIETTGLKWIPTKLDSYKIDYGFIIKEAFKSRNPLSHIPFAKFMSEPIGLSIAYKGCIYNCITCGGSCFAYKTYFKRDFLALKSPEAVAEEISSLHDYLKIPVFLVGDLRVLGRKYVDRLSKYLNEIKFDSPIFFEFFEPPGEEILSKLKKTSHEVLLQISPETHDQEIRLSFGRPYGNNELEDFIRKAVKLGFSRLDLYFMIGLPRQTYSNVVETPTYIKHLFSKVEGSRKLLDYFIAPLAPFIDPGSMVHLHPEKYGYKLFLRDLESHRTALEKAVSWKQALSYETKWMCKDEIVRASYEVAEEFIKLKIDQGRVKEKDGLKTIELIKEVKSFVESSNKPFKKPITLRETVARGDLYPTRKLILSMRLKFLLTALNGLLKG